MVCRGSRIALSGRDEAYMRLTAVILAQDRLNFHAILQEE